VFHIVFACLEIAICAFTAQNDTLGINKG